MPAGRRERVLAALGLLVVGALFAQRVVLYLPFISDDGLISLRYAQRLLDGHGLTWTDGERVEGYTDLAWVLLTAGLGALRVDLIVAARALGLLGAGVALLFTGLRPARPTSLSWVRVATGALFLALSDPLAVWAIGTLEHGFQAGMTVLGAWLLMRRVEAPAPVFERWALAVVFILVALLRADGAVLIGTLLLGNAVRALVQGEGFARAVRENVRLGLAPLLAVVAQLLFRRGYYGAWVPNTALVKVGMSLARLELGVQHLTAWARFAWPLLLAVGVVLLAARAERRRAWLIPLSASVCWFSYLAVVGGDIFPAWRQVLLGLAPLGLVLAEGADAAWAAGNVRARVAGGLALAVLAVSYGWLQRVDPDNRKTLSERWEHEGESLGPALRAGWGALRPLLAVDAAGTLPYHSGLPSLDLLGLNDRYIATHPPAGALSTGHELGDGEYTWARKPDLLAFCAGMGGRNPCYLGGRQMLAHPRFHETYQLMRYHTPAPPELRGELWVRREDSVLGIVRTADALRIPGWLLAERSGVTELHEGRFQALVSAVDPGWMASVAVPAGRWRVKVLPERPWTVGALCDGRSAPRMGSGPLILEVTGAERVDLLVGTRTPEGGFVSELLLERTEDPATLRCGRGEQVFDAALLNTVVPEGAHFLQPEGVLLFAHQAVRLRLPAGHSGRFELSLDANDGYRFRALKGDEVLAEGALPSVPTRGLAARTLEVPREADVLELVPESGDAWSGLGFVRALE